MFSPKQVTFLALVLTQLLGGINCASTTDTWLVSSYLTAFPDNAVWGGFDSSGYDLYVGRVYYSSNDLPARVVAELDVAYFNTDTIASQLNKYDILVSNETISYHWKRSYDGFLEKHAVSVGINSLYERVYVCRARTDGGLLIGTLYLAKRNCIIRSDSNVRQFAKYEILVRKNHTAEFKPFDVLVKN